METKSKHGMTSKQASERNLAGKKREKERKNQLPGSEVVTGRKKTDLKRIDGKTESIKGGTKTQWGLYSLRTIANCALNEKQKLVLLEYMNFLPDDKNEYLENREKYKNNPHAYQVLQEFSVAPIDLIKYFCGYGEIDYFTLIDKRDNMTYCIDSHDFFNKIEQSITNVYITDGGKLVIAGGEKRTILFELEMRKGSNHKKILFHSILSRIIDVVK